MRNLVWELNYINSDIIFPPHSILGIMPGRASLRGYLHVVCFDMTSGQSPSESPPPSPFFPCFNYQCRCAIRPIRKVRLGKFRGSTHACSYEFPPEREVPESPDPGTPARIPAAWIGCRTYMRNLLGWLRLGWIKIH